MDCWRNLPPNDRSFKVQPVTNQATLAFCATAPQTKGRGSRKLKCTFCSVAPQAPNPNRRFSLKTLLIHAVMGEVAKSNTFTGRTSRTTHHNMPPPWQHTSQRFKRLAPHDHGEARRQLFEARQVCRQLPWHPAVITNSAILCDSSNDGDQQHKNTSKEGTKKQKENQRSAQSCAS